MHGDNLSDILDMWREGTISNWEYLTQLNKMAGRSYNDLMQYPVSPFVLADYTSVTLDLNDSKSFRNFKKPMAIQNKCNEQHYIDNYNVSLGVTSVPTRPLFSIEFSYHILYFVSFPSM